MNYKSRNIAVYSGSFNPLHIGHLAIIRHMIEVAGFDMVYLIVSPKNPLKDGISSDSGRERYMAAVEAVERRFLRSGLSASGRNDSKAVEARVKVDDIELNMPEPHYTIRTLDALKEREPDNHFTFIMGADNLAGIRKWREYRRLLTEFGCAVYPRQGHDLAAIKEDLLNEDPSYRINIMNAKMVDISSSEIREGQARGEDMSAWLM